MRYVLLVLLACGCNQILGIDDNLHIVGDGGGGTIDSAAIDGNDLSDCATEVTCPTPADGSRMSVCGRVFDVESDGGIHAASPTGQRCGGAGQPDGACALGLSFYDALPFAANPTTATPEPVDSFTMDDCGRWVAEGVVEPGSGILVVAVDDGQGQPDMHRLTGGLLFPPPPGEIAEQYRAYSLSVATDTAWATQTGTSLIGAGAALANFQLADGTPVPGVSITLNGTTDPTHDYYFAGTGPSRSTIDSTMTVTGANGSAILSPISGIQNVSGTGGALPPGCMWPAQSGTTVANTLVIAFFVPRDTNGNPC